MAGAKKKWIQALLSALVTAALTLAMLLALADAVQRKDSDFEYGPFLRQEAAHDVLFFGTSHMIYALFPMELWKEQGIVSYNLAGHGIHIPTTYWVMKNALHYDRPKLVVVDCYLLGKETKMFNNFSQIHQSLDVFPLSPVKIRAAFDLTDDAPFEKEFAGHIDPARSPLGLLFDFSLYHERWRELGQDDLAPKYTVEKGAEHQIDVAAPRESVWTGDELEHETAGTEYLRRIIRDCRQEGIEVLLTYLPFPAGEEEWREANTAGRIAREMGVDYINFLAMDVVDYETDCFDWWSHLNPSGARKVTDYLGRYITEHYGIPDRREDPAYAGWYEDERAFDQFELELLLEQQELDDDIMLLSDPRRPAAVYLAGGAVWQGGDTRRALLANAGIDTARLPEGPCLAVLDRPGGGVSYLAPGGRAETSFGAVQLVQAEDGCQLILNGTAYAVGTDTAAAVAPIAEGAFAGVSRYGWDGQRLEA